MSATAAVSGTTPLASRLLAELTAIVGAGNVLHRDELLVYECDGYVVNRRCSTWSSSRPAPSTSSSWSVVQPARRPICAARGGHEPVRGHAGRGRRRDDLPDEDEAHLEINTRDRYAIVEPGVVNIWLTRALAGSGFHYPGPIQPDGLHHRRQRGHQFGRPAHAEVRGDGEPREGRRAGAPRRVGCRDWWNHRRPSGL